MPERRADSARAKCVSGGVVMMTMSTAGSAKSGSGERWWVAEGWSCGAERPASEGEAGGLRWTMVWRVVLGEDWTKGMWKTLAERLHLLALESERRMRM